MRCQAWDGRISGTHFPRSILLCKETEDQRGDKVAFRKVTQQQGGCAGTPAFFFSFEEEMGEARQEEGKGRGGGLRRGRGGSMRGSNLLNFVATDT